MLTLPASIAADCSSASSLQLPLQPPSEKAFLHPRALMSLTSDSSTSEAARTCDDCCTSAACSLETCADPMSSATKSIEIACAFSGNVLTLRDAPLTSGFDLT